MDRIAETIIISRYLCPCNCAALARTCTRFSTVCRDLQYWQSALSRYPELRLQSLNDIRQCSQHTVCRVAVCGPRGCGKTKLIDYYCGKWWDDDYIPTLAVTERVAYCQYLIIVFTEYPSDTIVSDKHDLIVVVVENNNHTYVPRGDVSMVWLINKYDVDESINREISVKFHKLATNARLYQFSTKSHYKTRVLRAEATAHSRSLMASLNM